MQGKNDMAPPASSSNLNARLSVTASAQPGSREVGIRWDATAIQSSAPPVRIVGARRQYRGGGFRISG
jgi:hypothetical protein